LTRSFDPDTLAEHLLDAVRRRSRCRRAPRESRAGDSRRQIGAPTPRGWSHSTRLRNPRRPGWRARTGTTARPDRRPECAHPRSRFPRAPDPPIRIDLELPRPPTPPPPRCSLSGGFRPLKRRAIFRHCSRGRYRLQPVKE
jgi:hypothetical protein